MVSIQPSVLDLKFVFRQLRKSPGFAITAVLMLAFGIGATVAIFFIVESVLLRPLPFTHPEQLVVITDHLQGSDSGGENDESGVTGQEVLAYGRDTQSFESVGAYDVRTSELSDIGSPARIQIARVSADLLPTLGIAPLLGRTFTKEEVAQAQPLAVLSYATWQARFQGNPQVLGMKIRLNRKPFTVIGVMPREFEFPLTPGQLNRTEVWVPLKLTDDDLVRFADSWAFSLVGRLKPGVSLSEAQSDAERVAQDCKRYYPAGTASGLRISAQILPLKDETVRKARPLLKILFLAVIVVLLIACANLACLLLVRVIRRQQEISVCLALGASGGSILRQVFLESMMVSGTGGLLGSSFAVLVVHLSKSLLPDVLPRISEIGVNWRMLTIALLLTIGTGLLCGVMPAAVALRTSILESLKEKGRGGFTGRGRSRLHSVLVVAEIAISLVLLTSAGLLLRSYDKMRSLELGFRPDHITTAVYVLPIQQYPNQAAVTAFDRETLRLLGQLPGIRNVGITTLLPVMSQETDFNTAFIAEGYVPQKDEKPSFAAWALVQGDYFRTMGIPLLRGRLFIPEDQAGAQLVAIVNKRLADHYWPNQDPIGKHLHFGAKGSNFPWLTVVGIIADVKLISPDTEAKDQLYQPLDQVEASLGTHGSPKDVWGNFGNIVIRSVLPPKQIENAFRETVRSIDPQLPLIKMQTMDEVVSSSEGPRRFNTFLLSAFALAAVLLAVLGIYSVIAYSTAARSQEMAIRLALGSQRSGILRLILWSAAKLIGLGCLLGLAGSFAVSGLLRSYLFDVTPFDPLVLLLALASIFALAMLASALPGFRATSISPMNTLRGE